MRAKTTREQLQENIFFGEHSLIYGPSGCGKTTQASLAAASCQRPFFTFHLGGVQDPEAAVKGALHLVSGETRFVRADFVSAIQQEKAVILLDEFNRVGSELTNVLLSLMDHQGVLHLELERDGERIVKLAPGVVFVATANVGGRYSGTTAMDQALVDRMARVRFDYDRSYEEALLVELGVGRAARRDLLRAIDEVRRQFDDGKLEATISTRRLRYVGRLVAVGHSIEDAILRNFHCSDESAETALRAVVKVVSR